MRNRLTLPFIILELIVIGVVFATAFGLFNGQSRERAGWLPLSGVGAINTGVPAHTASIPLPSPTNPVASLPIPLNTPTIGSSQMWDSTPTVTSTLIPSPTPPAWNVLTRCDAINNSGTFVLDRDLNSTGDCITIQASDVTLDCAGHSIQGTNRAGNGIVVRKYGLLSEQVPTNVEVRNCKLSRFFYGIYVESGNRLTIRDNVSSENGNDVDPVTRFGKFLGMVEGGGIRLNYVADSQIQNNITNHQAIGIDVRQSTGVSIRGNTTSYNSAWGINLLRTQKSEAIENQVESNLRKCTWGSGVVGPGCDASGIIIQDGASNNLIARNEIKGENGNGIFLKSHALPCGNNNSIISNTITSALYNSVELGFCTGTKVNNNIMRDGLDGILLVFTHDVEIKGNTISGMRNHGVISPNSHHITVSANHITNSNEGLFFYSEEYDREFFSWLPAGDYTSHDNCLCGNTFRSNLTAVHLKDSSYNRITENTFEDNRLRIEIQGRAQGNETNGNYGWQSPTQNRAMAPRVPSMLRALAFWPHRFH